MMSKLGVTLGHRFFYCVGLIRLGFDVHILESGKLTIGSRGFAICGFLFKKNPCKTQREMNVTYNIIITCRRKACRLER